MDRIYSILRFPSFKAGQLRSTTTCLMSLLARAAFAIGIRNVMQAIPKAAHLRTSDWSGICGDDPSGRVSGGRNSGTNTYWLERKASEHYLS